MNCPQCNGELRIVPEQVDVDSNDLPVFHRIAYCDNCMVKKDIDVVEYRDITNNYDNTFDLHQTNRTGGNDNPEIVMKKVGEEIDRERILREGSVKLFKGYIKILLLIFIICVIWIIIKW